MNLNKVFIVGRLTADPETRTTPSGQQVATIRVATNRVWNDRTSGQKQEQVEFHTIVAWAGLADVASKYLKKGQLAMFEGRLQTRSWQGNDGVKRYRTEIVAEGLQLGPKSGNFASAPASATASAGKPAPEVEDIPVIEENAPINPLGKEEGVEEAEIDLKDIPF
ncbi:MAG: single-stranded DNA-binding protein [Patescibacteria group bacterium]